jgi:hypothetical protein
VEVAVRSPAVGFQAEAAVPVVIELTLDLLLLLGLLLL